MSGCIGETEFPNTPQGNFEQLWKIIDERYCFHGRREVDWNEIYEKYQAIITPNMYKSDLFYRFSDMLNELQDGHVNLYGYDNQSSCWDWYSNYPSNFNEMLIRKYMGSGVRSLGDISYAILEGNIGYIYVGSFAYDVETKELDAMFHILQRCKGIIVDVRNNGGGSISIDRRLAARFANRKTLTGYLRHKTGKGHNDFSSPTAIYIEPSKNVRFEEKVVVLTNRKTYSAANDFVNNMRCLPQVTTVGGITGGGSGLPFTSELPNGWSVRFSASPHYGLNMECIEDGIEPDVLINLLGGDESKGIDTLIEKAILLLSTPTPN
ncbi:S41 family peptidase [Bacteroides sp. 214]|uniref:S41 family peptidase n=1 Tax=Bacteroides sp. 214 TaxID=2302935 RepID=UPI001EF32E46|nr:S41 family peptidase [Bacteroides sp. 214]